MISIQIEGVVKRFGSVEALKGVSIDIEPGELFFLLGPSGCGKTTLLRSIAGFYIPDAGTIAFGHEDVTNMPPHKRNTGMMFQSYALWPHMTVTENVAFGLEQRKLPKSKVATRVREALESVHMEAYVDRKPSQLSGGQQQRIALARALVVRPRCLLLDEPLSNLDAKLRLEMRLEIRRVCKAFNLTAIYVTHDQKEALSIADRVAVLKDGEVLQVGTPQEVYRRPRNRFVADFIGETNFIEGKVIRMGAGMILVETGIGEMNGISSDPEAEFEEGDAVMLSVRPESIRLDRYPADENCFSGVVGELTYYGEMAQYTFLVGADLVELKLFELNPKQFYSKGEDDLYAFMDPEDVIVLPKND